MAATRYDSLRSQLLLARAKGGGTLAVAEEVGFANELDICWHQMTDDEQRAAEADYLDLGGEA